MAAILCILALPVAADEVTVLALGDSLTHGYGLPTEDGLVPQLQAWLGENGADVRVINAGVSGDTTQGARNRVEWSLTPDVDAMIVELGGNDVLRGIDPAISRANLDAILAVAKDRALPVLLIGLPASGNYGPEYKRDFDAIFPDLAAKYGTLLIENFFEALAADGDPGAARRWMQADGLHPNAQGVSRIVGAIGPVVLRLVAQVD